MEGADGYETPPYRHKRASNEIHGVPFLFKVRNNPSAFALFEI
jgi:hypothetical protein